MEDEDYILALELQKQFDGETQLEMKDEDVLITNRSKPKYLKEDDLNSTCNLVHPQWETLDPAPDVPALFRAFDDKFFQGRLRCVQLEWSKRMYSCAGICYTRRNALGMSIIIRLSEPLLKLRSRKDLIETLLHEMIHAYCSVLGIREGNGGHGPNFKKIMNGINKVAGTNITVYHTFHDEVNVYKIHWWRCNGICQNRKPFFGYVKRSSNRAPSSNDIWWSQHHSSCGGTFLKIKGPDLDKNSSDQNTKKTKNGKKLNENSGIRKYLTPNQPLGIVPNEKNNMTSTIKSNTQTASNFGNGYSLNSTITSKSDTNILKDTQNRNVDREKLRDIWSKKEFPSTQTKQNNNLKTQENNETQSDKTIELSDSDIELMNDFSPKKDSWTVIDEEVMVKEFSSTVIDICSESDNSLDSADQRWSKPKSAEERQNLIKQEIIDTTIGDCFGDIELLDDDYNDELVNLSDDSTDTTLVDDLFNERKFLKEFVQENSLICNNSRYHADPTKEIVTCPVCQTKVKREALADHLDGCVGISVEVKFKPSVGKKKVLDQKTNTARKRKLSNTEGADNILRMAGYGLEDLKHLFDDSKSSDDSSSQPRRKILNNSTHLCPVCSQDVPVEKINEHLDLCLKI